MTDIGVVLVVDDDLPTLRVMSTALRTQGYAVRPADSGRLALQALERELPDLVLLDLRLGDMDGFDVLRRLRAAERTREVPVIVVSSLADVEMVVQALSLGAVDYVTKPFRNEELLARVGSQVRFARLRRLHRSLVDSLGEGVVVHAPDGRIIGVNPAAERLLGLTADELLGRTAMDPRWQILDADGAQLTPSQYPATICAQTGEPVRGVVMGVATPSGARTWVLVNAAPIAEREGDASGGVVVSFADVSSLRQAEQRLRESQHYYRLLAENATDLILQLDPDGVVTWVAPTVTRSLGWTPEELVGREAGELFAVEELDDPGSSTGTEPAGDGTAAAGVQALLLLATRTGTFRWMSARAHALRDRDGRPIGRVVGMQDVDDLVRAREDAEQARAREQRTRLSMDAAVIGMALTALDGRFTYVNPAMCRILGYDRAELQGKSFTDVTHPDDVADGQQAARDLAAGSRDSYTHRKRYLTKAGAVIWAELSVACVRDAAGRALHFVAQVVDVTAEVTSAAALQRSMNRYQMLAENASDVVYLTDPDGVLQWVSPSMASVLGWDPDALVGTPARDLVIPEDLPHLDAERTRVYAGERRRGILVRLRTSEGGSLTMSVTAHPVLAADGRVTGAISALRDVTAEQDALHALERSEAQYRLLAENATDVVYRIRTDGTVDWISDGVRRFLGWAPSDLVGRGVLSIVHPDDRGVAVDRLPAVLADDFDPLRLRLLTSTGGSRWVETVARPVRDPDGSPVSVVGGWRDIDDEVAARQELDRRARTDALTGLANRGEGLDRLGRMLASHRRSGGGVAVAFCDIDGLKAVNDRYGHAAGDALIAAVAARITSCIRSADLVARVGGDEILLVLDGIHDLAEATATVEKVGRTVAQPLAWEQVTLAPTLSIGVTLAEPGADMDAVIARADRAMYQAKQGGRNRIVDL